MKGTGKEIKENSEKWSRTEKEMKLKGERNEGEQNEINERK